ncbi:MAG: glycosyltransferase [Ardenticatenaceae bacterium]|nr:glycosyltransferase [Ardenticatenaceae bacterium]
MTNSPKNILIATIGSHGDVHPIMAMGLALQRRGHCVTLITSSYFDALVRDAGLGFIGLGSPEDYWQTVENPDLWHPTRAFEVVVNYGIRPTIQPIYDIIAQQDPTNTIVVASSLVIGARIAHEKLGVPLVTHHLQSSLIRSLSDPPVMGNFALPASWPNWLKRAYFRFLDGAFIDRLLAPETNRVRAELGLPPVKSIFGDWMHSPQKVLCLFPDWYAPPQPDWPPNTEMVGFIRYDGAESSIIPPELEAFLQAGEPPIVFTPGTAMQHGRSFFEASVQAAQILGKRALLLSRHRDHIPEHLPDSIRYFEYVPFSLVLPRTAALVYHGGIGTLAQAMAAGIPHLVMPLSHDQPDNARLIKRLGVGDSLLPKEYKTTAVVQKLDHLLNDPIVQAKCQEYARRMDFEQSLAKACDVIEQVG